MLNKQAFPTASENRAVIVGGGMAGLLTALRLAKKGLEVTVVEKNSQFGGCFGRLPSGTPITCFTPLGLEHRGSINQLLSEPETATVPYVRKELSDIVILPHAMVELPGSLAEFQRVLTARYPAQAEPLNRFCTLLTQVHAAISAGSALGTNPVERTRARQLLHSLAGRTYRSLLSEMFSSAELRALLSVRAFSSKNSALTMLAYLAKILVDGLYGITGNIPALADRIVAELDNSPACTLLPRRAVTEILFDEEKRANGVRLDNGGVIAGRVVLNVDPNHACEQLIREESVRKHIGSAIAGYPSSLSAVTLIFSVTADLGRELMRHVRSARIFHCDAADPFDVLVRREHGALDTAAFKINFDTDGSSEVRRVYVELDCSIKAADFATMYGDEKRALDGVIGHIGTRLRRLEPGILDGITSVEVVTPYLLALITNNRMGASSGFADLPGGLRELDHRLSQHGLLQVGQWSSFGSGLSQLESSAVAAYGSLARHSQLSTVRARNLA